MTWQVENLTCETCRFTFKCSYSFCFYSNYFAFWYHVVKLCKVALSNFLESKIRENVSHLFSPSLNVSLHLTHWDWVQNVWIFLKLRIKKNSWNSSIRHQGSFGCSETAECTWVCTILLFLDIWLCIIPLCSLFIYRQMFSFIFKDLDSIFFYLKGRFLFFFYPLHFCLVFIYVHVMPNLTQMS